jgi:hypothetical protein
MGPSKAGGLPWKRAILSLTTALLLLTPLLPTPSGAAEINLHSRTFLLYYQRDLLGVEDRNYAPLFEYLSADVRNLGGSDVSFHFYGWGRLDLGDDTGTANRSGDIGSAYLRYVHPAGNGEARLGRFFLTEGAAFEILDGIFVKVRAPVGIGVSAYGGLPVERSIASTETGDSLFGGRVFFARPGFAEIGASYLRERGNFQGSDRKEIGGDLWLRPFALVELIGRAAYNEATSAMASQRYLLRIAPAAQVDLSLGFEQYKYRDYFQTALNPAFVFPAIDNTDKARVLFATLEWEFAKNLTVELGAKDIRHDRAVPGDAIRGELGFRYTYNDRKDVAGISAAVVSADRDENEYREYRAFASYSPAKWRFALDALTHRYKREIRGEDAAYQVVGSAGYQVAGPLQLTGNLTYTKSPQFKEDFAGLVRASLSFDASTGGKK